MALVCPAQEEFFGGVQDMYGTKVYPFITYLGQDVN